MKPVAAVSVIALLVALLLPVFWRAPAAAEPAPTPLAGADAETVLTVKTGDTVTETTMAEYLPGVLAGEMPALFEQEALKAQAVAARTYILYRAAHRPEAHLDADICDDPACCKAWASESDLREKWGEQFDTYYAKMTAVCDFVRAGLPYIATHPDFNCPTETGFAPDIGAIIAFIEASTGRRPDLIIGKPYGGIVEEALKATGLQKDELAMVGDRLYTDIATGRNFGILSILVLTGEATLQDVEASDVKPDLIFDRLSSMNPYLKG